MNPKISIIVPIYNVEKYLRECLESVKKQTLREFECICVNDGSTDNSLEIAEEFAREDVRFTVYSKENGGLSSARNFGIQKAQGEYIYLLDSDDYIELTAMDTLYGSAKKDNLDILFFEGKTFYEEENLKEQYSYYDTAYLRKNVYDGIYTGKEVLVQLITAGDYIVSACLQMVRREYLLENNIWFCEGVLYEDNIFTIHNLYKAQRVGCIHSQLFNRRMRAGSIVTTKVSFHQMYSMYRCYMEQLKLLLDTQDPKLQDAFSANLDNFYRRIMKLYDELMKRKLTDEEKQQLNSLSWYERSTLYHLGVHFPGTYIFPYKEIEKAQRLVLYGAGKVGQNFFQQLTETEYCKEIFWVDKSYEIHQEQGRPVHAPEEIDMTKQDVLLIAVAGKSLAASIKEELIGQGIEEDKIKWYAPRVELG